jgi:hypothetical protein
MKLSDYQRAYRFEKPDLTELRNEALLSDSPFYGPCYHIYRSHMKASSSGLLYG